MLERVAWELEVDEREKLCDVRAEADDTRTRSSALCIEDENQEPELPRGLPLKQMNEEEKERNVQGPL